MFGLPPSVAVACACMPHRLPHHLWGSMLSPGEVVAPLCHVATTTMTAETYPHRWHVEHTDVARRGM